MNLFSKRINRETTIPAHTQVRTEILDLIREGILRVGEKLPPEPEIAQRLGVSRMTANKAILALVGEGLLTREKGRGTFVTEGRPAKLQRCIVAIPEDLSTALDNYYFGALYWAVHSELQGRGVTVGVERLSSSISDQVTGGPDCGFIVISPAESSLDDLLAFSRQGSPLVILGASWGDYGFNLVDSDNFLGSALAVNHLADLGHRRILFIGAAPDSSNTVDRVRGFRLAMKGRQIPLQDGDVWVIDHTEGLDTAAENILSALLVKEHRPTAIVAAGPVLAMQVLSVAQKCGLNIPEDLSIVGYDDPTFLKLAYPPITTIRQPLATMARSACNLLLNRLESRDPRAAKEVLDPELIIRSTTCVPPLSSSEES